MEITQDFLKEHFEYRDGKLFWKKLLPKFKSNIGDELGKVNDKGYIACSFKGKNYKLHRLIFLYHHNNLPEQIDHINNKKGDNRIENLRPATNSQNAFNIVGHSDALTSTKNVWKVKDGKKQWRGEVCCNGVRYNIPRQSTKDEAESAVTELRNRLHGEFVNHGIKE